MAKSKVAPIKAQTIPKLELCSAQLSSKLISKVSADLAALEEAIFAWTDSAVVLGWLKMPANHLKVFVANRVAEITSRVDVDHWRYVSTHLNPADLISRGIMPAGLTENSLWWREPRRLALSPAQWPRRPDSQRFTYACEIQCLQKQRALPSTHSLSGLAPYLDSDEVMRVGGRL